METLSPPACLSEKIARAPRAWISGSSGTGKTTLLLKALEHRLHAHITFVSTYADPTFLNCIGAIFQPDLATLTNEKAAAFIRFQRQPGHPEVRVLIGSATQVGPDLIVQLMRKDHLVIVDGIDDFAASSMHWPWFGRAQARWWVTNQTAPHKHPHVFRFLHGDEAEIVQLTGFPQFS